MSRHPPPARTTSQGPRGAACLLAALVALGGCRSEPLAPSTTSLRFELLEASPQPLPSPILVFPGTWTDGSARTGQVKLVNIGNRSVEVTYQGPGAPFFGSFPTRVPPGETLLTVQFQPADARSSGSGI